MNLPGNAEKRILVIGGGITGLAAAHRLVELDPSLQVTVLEAGPRLGGVLETVRRDGFLMERSADNFITSVPWAVDLCRRIGLGDELIPTASQERNAMVVHRGRLEKVPPGFMLMAPSRLWPLVTTPILSPWGKLRLLGEYLVPRRKVAGDESLASFARRRLGRETFERIVQPLVGGIYTADPERLSLLATLPRFLEMERRHGGLIRGAIRGRANVELDESENGSSENGTSENARGKDGRGEDASSQNSSGARYGLFVAPREGLSSLVEAVAARLPAGCIRLNATVDSLAREANGSWTVEVGGDGGAAERLECAGLIVAIGAPAASRLLAPVDRQLAGDLSRITYAGTAIVTLAFRRDQIDHPLDGFGFVVPAIENRRILAGSFASVKFPGRAPAGSVLVRVFIGGACQSELLDLPDDALCNIAVEELLALLGTHGAPLFAEISRWPTSMPQYHVGHCELVAAIERAAAKWTGLALAGNAYHGVGIPNCIHSGEQAAERLWRQIAAAKAAY